MFSSRSATVTANEAVTLFGAPIISGRHANYAASHPEQTRETFIRTGLVEREWETRSLVMIANRFAYDEAERLTDRIRQPGLLISDRVLYDLYVTRLPAEVISGATFGKHVKSLGDDSVLWSTPANCMTDPGAFNAADFPDRWQVSGLELPASCVYDPGMGHDGVTIEVRLEQLGVLESESFTWQVPGLREDPAAVLVRNLPKRVRTSFVPAPDFARRAVTWFRKQEVGGKTAFPEALGRALAALTGEWVASSDRWPEATDPRPRPTFVVVEGRKEVGWDGGLVALKTRLSAKVTSRLTRSTGRIAATDRTDWDSGKLPLTQRLDGGIVSHPCLVDEGSSVGMQVVDSAVKAERPHAARVRRLLMLVNPSPIHWVVSHPGNPEGLALGMSRYGSISELLEDAWPKASDRLLRAATDPVRIRDGQEFQCVAEAVRIDCPAATAAVIDTAAKALTAQVVMERRLAALSKGDEMRTDVTEQLVNLTFRRFISATPDPRFDHTPVRIEICGTRFTTHGRDPTRSERNHSEVMELEVYCGQLCEAQPPGSLPTDVGKIASLLEKLWVSLFAQGTHTLVPVSTKRISQVTERIRR